MKSAIQDLAAKGLIYGLGASFNGLVSFLLIPFFTHRLTAGEYGRYALAEMVLNLLLVLLGMGAAGSRLLGKVIKVSEELQSGTAVPALCTVQVTGVARFKYAAVTPVIGQKVELDGAGKVRQAATATDVPAGGTKHRGIVLAVTFIAIYRQLRLQRSAAAIEQMTAAFRTNLTALSLLALLAWLRYQDQRRSQSAAKHLAHSFSPFQG